MISFHLNFDRFQGSVDDIDDTDVMSNSMKRGLEQRFSHSYLRISIARTTG